LFAAVKRLALPILFVRLISIGLTVYGERWRGRPARLSPDRSSASLSGSRKGSPSRMQNDRAVSFLHGIQKCDSGGCHSENDGFWLSVGE